MHLRRIALIGLLWLATGGAGIYAQERPDSTDAGLRHGEFDIDAVQDFRLLFRERDFLLSKLQPLGERISLLEARNAGRDTTQLKYDTIRASRDLATARARTVPDEAVIQGIERYISDRRSDLEDAKSSIRELSVAKEQEDRYARRLFAVEQRIASLFDSTRDVNAFRSRVTITFGILVSLVILGFYLIAWYKQGVAKTIFAGEMGMQFVTLFLIVIAIILFGIMGTLEGRELAALLGGLSGYILGRASDARQQNRDDRQDPSETVHSRS